jgi:predicted kinase
MASFTESLFDQVPLGCNNRPAQRQLARTLATTRSQIKKLISKNVPSDFVRERVQARADERLMLLMRLLSVDFQ